MFGPHDIGVRTIQVTDRNRPDILSTKEGAPTARYDRTLTLEVWYPATLAPGRPRSAEYFTITRDPEVPTMLRGRAVRDAEPARPPSAFPLVIISHGYPGNRYLMSHLGENLATKGFVAVSIDHTDSTYGVVNTIGGGYSDVSVTGQGAPPNRLLADRAASNAGYRASIDSRVKAAIAIGPWGMQAGFWTTEGLKGITTPLLLVAGSADEVSGYEKGTRPNGKDAVFAMDRDGTPTAAHNYWKGFKRGTAVGLILEHAPPAK